MDRNDERNDRMLDSNDFGGATPNRASSGAGDPTIQGTERPRRTDDLADDRRVDDHNPGDEIGEAVGGISGVLTGAALGSLGGPIGTIIGGIAGAVSGWWAGRAISEAASHVTNDDETYYRDHYERSPNRLADRSYDDVRPAYQLGHLAGRNPEYQGRNFDEVETDLRRGWSGDVSARHGDWDQVRHYARDAYERGRSGFGTGAVAGAATTQTGTAQGGMSQGGMSQGGESYGEGSLGGGMAGSSAGGGLAGTGTTGSGFGSVASSDLASAAAIGGRGQESLGGASASGMAPTNDTLGGASGFGNTTGEGLGNTGGLSGASTGAGAAGGLAGAAGYAAGRTADGIDDVKDRVDGNPASRPGLDATDRPGYGANTGTANTAGPAAAGRPLGDAPDARGLGDYNRTGQMGDSSDIRGADVIGNTGDRVENAADRAGNKVGNAWERVKDGARNLADRTEDKLDDTKDRVDGNPASRPGPDRTDDPDRRY